jgi:hypothetical protein
MLIKHANITTAYFASLDQVKIDEVNQADVINIRGFVEGGIYHSRAFVWRALVHQDISPLEHVRSKKERKAIGETEAYFTEKGYAFKVIELTEEMFYEFKELYAETTMKKERAFSYDLDSMVLGRIKVGEPVFISGLFEGQKLASGILFTISKQGEAKVSYGAKRRFQEVRGGAGGILEFKFLEFCQQKNVFEVSHGRELAPVGIYSNSGLFEFKARYGNTAFPTESWQTTFIRNQDIALSDLVFVSMFENKVGYIVATKQQPEEVMNKYKTREVDSIKVITFDELQKQYQEFEKKL